MVRTQGVPNFTVEQYQKAMNVLVLESRIEGMVKLKRHLKQHSSHLDSLVYQEGKKLLLLTGNVPAKDFWDSLLRSRV